MGANLRDTDHDWQVLAEERPYWGVLSAAEYDGKTIPPEARKQFFRSGEVLISNIFGFIHQHINEGFRPERSLDFGCGVGRLLLPIARLSGTAVGVDVAPGMLNLAAENAAAAGIANVTFAIGDDNLANIEGSFDFVNSYIVIQHIPPERGYRLLEKLFEKIRVGGVGSIQLTYAKARRFLAHEAITARYYRRDGRALIDLVQNTNREAPSGSIVMYDYDLNELFAMITDMMGVPALVLPTRDDDHLGLHLVFCRSN